MNNDFSVKRFYKSCIRRGRFHICPQKFLAGRKAFMLVELLIAILLMSYLGVVLYDALHTSIRGVGVVNRAFRLPRMTLMASRIFEREFTGVYLPEEIAFTPPEETEQRFLKEKWVYGLIGKEREVHFTTRVPLNEEFLVGLGKEETEERSVFDKQAEDFPVTDILKISYEFDRDEKKLKKRISPVPDDKLEKGGVETELNLWLSEVKFEYYDKKWENSWDSRSAGKLPRAIKLSLEFIEPPPKEGSRFGQTGYDEEREPEVLKHEMVVLLPNAADNRKKF
jgi:hypothetical protein